MIISKALHVRLRSRRLIMSQIMARMVSISSYSDGHQVFANWLLSLLSLLSTSGSRALNHALKIMLEAPDTACCHLYGEAGKSTSTGRDTYACRSNSQIPLRTTHHEPFLLALRLESLVHGHLPDSSCRSSFLAKVKIEAVLMPDSPLLATMAYLTLSKERRPCLTSGNKSAEWTWFRGLIKFES